MNGIMLPESNNDLHGYMNWSGTRMLTEVVWSSPFALLLVDICVDMIVLEFDGIGSVATVAS